MVVWMGAYLEMLLSVLGFSVVLAVLGLALLAPFIGSYLIYKALRDLENW